jgi:hypothetical protein
VSDSLENLSSLGQLVGFSAVISGLVSVFVGYLMNIRHFKKQNKVRQLELKISLYSFLIFQFDRMRFTWKSLDDLEKVRKQEDPDQEHYAYSTRERQEMFKDMTKKIEQDYYLFKQDFLKQWINVSIAFTHPSAIGKVPQLNKLLVEEYNKTIQEYEKISGNKLESRT